MRIFGGDRVKRMMDTLGIPDDQPIEHGLVSKTIESAQHKIEGMNFDMRKHVLDFDDVLNKQREVIYGRRRKVLKNEINLKEQILEKINAEIEDIVTIETDPEVTAKSIGSIFSAGSPPLNLPLTKGEKEGVELWINHLTNLANHFYSEKENKITEPIMREIEKIITLQAIDNLWMEHLDTMDHLRQSVRLRGYAQKDPLIEYKQDGLRLFERMLKEIDKTIVYTIYKVELRPREQMLPSRAPVNFPSLDGRGEGRVKGKIGRNDPCPCGSGKKWKKCGMINSEEHQQLIVKKWVN